MRQFLAALAICALISGAGGPAIGQTQNPSVEVFIGAASSCLDWIDAAQPDTVPFADWQVVTPFPEGKSETGDVAGIYVYPGTLFTVTMSRGQTSGDCTGLNSGLLISDAAAALESWIARETGAGRLTPAQDRASFGYPFAVCVGAGGGFDMIRAADETLAFYFQTGTKAPTQGVCDA